APAAGLGLPEGRGFARQLRVGVQDNNSLRLVIDLSAAATPRVFAVEPSGTYGHRLVVDLLPGASAPVVPPTPVKSVVDASRDIIVAIDAGHGGADPGSIGRR